MSTSGSCALSALHGELTEQQRLSTAGESFACPASPRLRVGCFNGISVWVEWPGERHGEVAPGAYPRRVRRVDKAVLLEESGEGAQGHDDFISRVYSAFDGGVHQALTQPDPGSVGDEGSKLYDASGLWCERDCAHEDLAFNGEEKGLGINLAWEDSSANNMGSKQRFKVDRVAGARGSNRDHGSTGCMGSPVSSGRP